MWRIGWIALMLVCAWLDWRLVREHKRLAYATLACLLLSAMLMSLAVILDGLSDWLMIAGALVALLSAAGHSGREIMRYSQNMRRARRTAPMRRV